MRPRPPPSAQSLAMLTSVPSDPTGSRSRKVEPYASLSLRIPPLIANRILQLQTQNGASCDKTELTPARNDGQPTQVLPLDAPNRLDHIRIRRRCAGCARSRGIHDRGELGSVGRVRCSGLTVGRASGRCAASGGVTPSRSFKRGDDRRSVYIRNAKTEVTECQLENVQIQRVPIDLTKQPAYLLVLRSYQRQPWTRNINALATYTVNIMRPPHGHPQVRPRNKIDHLIKLVLLLLPPLQPPALLAVGSDMQRLTNSTCPEHH